MAPLLEKGIANALSSCQWAEKGPIDKVIRNFFSLVQKSRKMDSETPSIQIKLLTDPGIKGKACSGNPLDDENWRVIDPDYAKTFEESSFDPNSLLPFSEEKYSIAGKSLTVAGLLHDYEIRGNPKASKEIRSGLEKGLSEKTGLVLIEGVEPSDGITPCYLLGTGIKGAMMKTLGREETGETTEAIGIAIERQIPIQAWDLNYASIPKTAETPSPALRAVTAEGMTAKDLEFFDAYQVVLKDYIFEELAPKNGVVTKDGLSRFLSENCVKGYQEIVGILSTEASANSDKTIVSASNCKTGPFVDRLASWYRKWKKKELFGQNAQKMQNGPDSKVLMGEVSH